MHWRGSDINMSNKVYAEYAKDIKNVRLKSSSGGAFNRIANRVLEQGGIVYGVIFDSDLKKARYSNTDVLPLEKLMRSKYIAAEIGDTFRQVEEQLKSGRFVLFSGTPCVVAGMKKYIHMKYPISEDRLLLVDFLCEGVPSPEIFVSYIEELESKYKDKVVDVQFRSKAFGWTPHCMKVIFASGKEYIKPYFRDSYISTFIELLFNRPVCYQCAFRENKESDITLADFWRIREILPEWANDNLGVSAVFANTEKGDKWILQQKEVTLKKLSDVDCEFAKQHLETEAIYEKRNKFFETWMCEGYAAAIKKHSKFGKRVPLLKRMKQIKFSFKLLKVQRKKKKLIDGKR